MSGNVYMVSDLEGEKRLESITNILTALSGPYLDHPP